MKGVAINVDGIITLAPIAYMRCELKDKFGVPRQSGIVKGLRGRIEFAEDFRDENYVRGIEQYSHLWLLWGFSDNFGAQPSPTVRPPRLGGNTRLGVFATRSPFRPNPLGLSCVKLEGAEKTGEGIILLVSGVDMTDNTPIYDIKPYLPYVDSVPDASGGFAEERKEYRLAVEFPSELSQLLQEEKRRTLCEILSGDPRPAYQRDPERVYGLSYADCNVRFTVDGEKLTVTEIEKCK